MREFLDKLASSDPTPGGGGASALIAAIGCCLGSMVANLTTGKKKYAEYQDKIDEYISVLSELNNRLIADIDKDAAAFAPLAAAYSKDKNDPDYATVMEEATYNAAVAPLEIAEDIYKLVPIIEDLCIMGSRLAIGDIAVAATAIGAALEGVVMNVYINTKSLNDRQKADDLNSRADKIVKDGCARLDKVYKTILADMTKA